MYAKENKQADRVNQCGTFCRRLNVDSEENLQQIYSTDGKTDFK
jgi:hypothetical protein